MQPVLACEALVREGQLPDLAGMDDGQQPTGTPMDDLLVQLAEQRRADSLPAPLGMERQRHQMRVGTAHAGDDSTDDRAGRDGDHRRLVFVEGLDHIAPAVGGAGGRAGQIDEADDLFEGYGRVTVVEGECSPVAVHRHHLLVVMPTTLANGPGPSGTGARSRPFGTSPAPLSGSPIRDGEAASASPLATLDGGDWAAFERSEQ